MSEIGRWLEGLGLGHFASTFADAAIDLDVLPEITEGDLEKLGIPLGHRKRLMKAIAALGEAPSPVEPEASAAGRETTSAAASAARSDAERRQLTVMFVDLVGSTALSARLDPEDMRDVIRTYQDACAGVITRFEGHVAKYMGDGVLAYFGWPRAHEDEAERAVRAGIDLVQTIATLEPKPGLDLAARVGIATGLVVVGDLIGEGSSEEQAVVGETPNLAARLQALAEPGSVVIAEATGRLVGAAFELRNLGPQTVKGLAEPVAAFAVAGERATASRFEARSGLALSPMVGRDQELALLLERWGQAKAGEGQGVVLVGEAGIGKSRISRALLDAVTDEPHVRIRYQCSPYHTDSALWPVIQQLSHAAGLNADDLVEARLVKLEALLDQAGGRDAAPLIADLIGLNGTARYGELDLAPQMQRARTFEALVAQLLGLAARQPLLVVLEDAHWIDPSTLELMEQCLDRIAAARVMILLTSRPDRRPQLAGHPHVTRLTLNRLGRGAVETIVARLGGDITMPPETIDAIIAHTDGVPLFVEELTKTVLETGEASIPASLRDSLMARLDHIPEVREIAQIAACIGREFDWPLLTAVVDRSEPDLRRALDKLADAELIFRRGEPAETVYSFKHALLQDAAYQSLLKSKRRRLHARIVDAQEERLQDGHDVVPEWLAQHCEAAGRAHSAAKYRLQAGRAALESSAAQEAAAHFSHGVRLLESLADKDALLELELWKSLGAALIMARGYAAPETGDAFQRTLDLCEEQNRTDHVPDALYGLALFNMDRGHHRTALAFAERLLAAAGRDSTTAVLAHRMVGSCHLYLGNFDEMRWHCEAGLALYESRLHDALRFTHAQDQKVSLLVRLSRATLALGYPLQAMRHARSALARARALEHPHTQAFTMHTLAFIFHDLRRAALLERFGGVLLNLAEKHKFPAHRAGALFALGSAALFRGEHELACNLLTSSLEAHEAAHSHYLVPLVLGDLAVAEGRNGQRNKARTHLREALEMVERNEERCFEAPLRHFLGDLISRDESVAAGDQFGLSLEVARNQNARWFELRAATSLARLWAEQGERQRARDLLAPVYSWFTEGFDAADLTDAKMLLDDLI